MSPPALSAVHVEGLVVRYGDLVAVDHLSLSAERGEVVALLGPNGAGKTSTVETLEGYRRPSAGIVRVLGLDPHRDHAALRSRIGVMLQSGGVYPGMRPLEALQLFASYYANPEDPTELLTKVGLDRVAHTPWRRLSGGEQQRLSLALALVARPEVAFLDEPTAGMDPQARAVVRQTIQDLRTAGTCILLTTHQLDDAEHLADRVVVISEGNKRAEGTVADLTRSAATNHISFATKEGLDVEALGAALGRDVNETTPGTYAIAGEASPALVTALTTWLAEHNATLRDLQTQPRTLEETYLHLLSRPTQPGDAEGTDKEVPRVAPTEGAPPVGAPPEAGDSRPQVGETGGEGSRRRQDPGHRSATTARKLRAQTRTELTLTLRRGESVLLTLGIPVMLLAFFSTVDVLPVDTDDPVDFLAPGILALAVMSTAMVSLGIATAFERQYGVLKRLGATPLGRPALLAAKTAAILAIEVLQVAVLVAVAVALGWRPDPNVGPAVGAALLATVAFAGLGLLMAGALRAETVLAGANGLYLLLLLLGGMVIPLAELPGGLRAAARGLPAAALSDVLHPALAAGAAGPGRAWLVLAVWAAAAPVAAALTFRWE